MREFLICLVLVIGVAMPLSCVTINNTSTPCGAGGSMGVTASVDATASASASGASPCSTCLDVVSGASTDPLCQESQSIFDAARACGCSGACGGVCAPDGGTCGAIDGSGDADCKACMVTGCSVEWSACIADDGSSSDASSSTGSTGGGSPCPVCSEAIAGQYNGDELCPTSRTKFTAVNDCACTDGGACQPVCHIEPVIPGDVPTCGLVDPAASQACAICIADAATGCGVLFAACQSDDGG